MSKRKPKSKAKTPRDAATTDVRLDATPAETSATNDPVTVMPPEPAPEPEPAVVTPPPERWRMLYDAKWRDSNGYRHLLRKDSIIRRGAYDVDELIKQGMPLVPVEAD